MNDLCKEDMKICQVSVQLDNLRKTFADTVALDIDSMRVEAGEILGLVGNNGAGKTTLFRLILDLVKPDSGSAVILGRDSDCGREVSFLTAECEDWKSCTGAYIDSGFLIDYLTPEEYFAFIGKVGGISKEELDRRLSPFRDLMNGEVIGQNKLIRNLSAGNKQKVGIISAMLRAPQLLILDEPFNFLDPSSQLSVRYILDRYNKETGATIMISSHNLSHTLDICSRVALLESGHIIRQYTSDNADMAKEVEAYFAKSVHYE